MKKLPLHRNVWTVGFTSFFTDISSEMIINTLPLFLSQTLKVKANTIGLIEGVAESTASLLKIFSGWLSDRLRMRKGLALLGYTLSALSKPFFLGADHWLTAAFARWGDRVGKGIRTAPRDALVADSIPPQSRGLAFGFHRAMDTAGAFVGLAVALGLIWRLQGASVDLKATTFRTLVLVSLVPAFLAVLVLLLGARDVKIEGGGERPKFGFRGLGKEFLFFLMVVGIFELGNSSDAFLVLRLQNLGLSVTGIMATLIGFNFLYTLVSTPAGILSDRIGRKRVLCGGFLLYIIVYAGFALSDKALPAVFFYLLYGLYYGLTYGTAKALVADAVEPRLRGIAFGTYNAILGLSDLPASLLAGVLWSGLGPWKGFGPRAPFLFGALTAFIALVLLLSWKPQKQEKNL